MDLPTIASTLRASDHKGAHTTAVAGLLLLCARAYRHLPPQVDPLAFTVIPAEEVSHNKNKNNGSGAANTAVANGASDFSRAGSGIGGMGVGASAAAAIANTTVGLALSNLLSGLSPTDIEAFTPELRSALDSWPSASKHHILLRRSTGSAVASSTTTAANSGTGSGAAASVARGITAMHVVPLVEAAQEWADAYPLSLHGGDAGIASEARDTAVAAATVPVAANPGAVLQFILSATVLPHMSRDTCRSLLLIIRLLPSTAASAAAAAAAGAKTTNFWGQNIAAFADTLLAKRATMSNAQTIQTAESLLRETLARGLLKPDIFAASNNKKDDADAASADEKSNKLLLAAWTHLLMAWASVTFDPAHRRTHKHRSSVGLLAVPEAHSTARRKSPLFSDSVRRLATAIVLHSSADGNVARFALAFATGDGRAIESVTTSLPASSASSLELRERYYVRGRLAVASALIFWENKQLVCNNQNNSNNVQKQSNKLSMPFNFVHLTADQHHGLIDEVWPPASVIASPHFAQEAAARYPSLIKNSKKTTTTAADGEDDVAASDAKKNKSAKKAVKITTERLSFCSPDEASDVAETVLDKIKNLRTTAASVKDLVLVSQFAVSPALFAEHILKQSGGASSLQWDKLVECFVSNSQNINPGVAESILAPAIAAWASPADAAAAGKNAAALAATVNRFHTSKCSSGTEKASLLLTLAAVLRHNNANTNNNAVAAAAVNADVGAFVQMFQACLSSSSPVILNAAWAVFTQLPATFQKSSVIAPFLKPLLAANSSAAQKRACLAYATPQLDLAPLHTHLLESVEKGIVTALPDAFLSLVFPESAASKKLLSQQQRQRGGAGGASKKGAAGGSSDDSGSDGDSEDVKAWTAQPECAIALLQEPAPEQTLFDPAAGVGGAAPSASGAGASSAATLSKNQRRLAEAHSALTWQVFNRGLAIAQSLAVEHLACGPIVTFLGSKRGLARELAARVALGTHRLRTEKAPRKKVKKAAAASSSTTAAAAAAAAASSTKTGAAAASAPTTSTASTTSSLFSSAPRALSAWKYLSTVLLPFVESKYTLAAGLSSASRNLAAGVISACTTAAEFSGGSEAAAQVLTSMSAAMGADAAAAAALAAETALANLRLRDAITLLARGVLAHVHVTDPGETIAAVLCACSHPAVIGCVDPDFESPTCRLTGMYRPDSITPMLRAARAIFGTAIGATHSSGDGNRVAARDVNKFAKHIIDNGVAVAQALCSVLAAPVAPVTAGMGAPSPSTASSSASTAAAIKDDKKKPLTKGGASAAAAAAVASGSSKNKNNNINSNNKTTTTEARRSAARAFSLLQAYLDSDTQHMTSLLLLNSVLRDTVDSKFNDETVLDQLSQAAMQPDMILALRQIVCADLFKRGVLKNHGDRPPKGQNAEDWKDACLRLDKKAAEQLVERLRQVHERHIAAAMDRVCALLVPFAAVRHLASLPRAIVSLDSVAALLPFLMEESDNLRNSQREEEEDYSLSPSSYNALVASILPEAARNAKPVEFLTLILAAECTEDAACSLLKLTPLRSTATSMVRVYRLLGKQTFESSTVAEANAFAHALRLSVTNMLPPELVPPLLLVARRFFKVFKKRGAKQPSAAAQHQFMSVLATCFGNRSIGGKREAAELLFLIAENHFGLHRMTTNSIVQLCGHLSPAEVVPVAKALLTGGDIGRECAVQGLERFCKQFGLETRLGGVLASAACFDPKASVAAAALALVASIKFEPQESDWRMVADLLNKYHYSDLAVLNLARYALVIARRCSGDETSSVITAASSAAKGASAVNSSGVTSAISAAPAAAASHSSGNSGAGAASRIDRSELVSSHWLPSILLMPRQAAVAVLDALAPTLTDDAVLKALDHLATIIEDSNSEVGMIRACSSAGGKIVASATDAAIARVIQSLKPRLKKSASAVPQHRELHNGANIHLLTALAIRTSDANELVYVLDEVVTMCGASQTAYVHRVACDCVRRLAATKTLRRSDRIAEIGQAALKSMMTATVYAKKKGHAHIYAGLCAGAGLLFLRRTDFMETIQTAARDKQQSRMASMILLECCCDIIGESFEPYALALTPILIDGIAEKDDKINECADDAAKAFMRCMSEAALHQLIPKLIEALSGETSDSKKRAPALNLIGYTAFCSPKQLVATLPSIMQRIMDALCDVNVNISRAAYNALRRVAGVVSNEEIKGHVDILLEAMRNPDETENALDALLYTRFFTRVDPASLAILAPVVVRGLGEASSEVRGKAAQVVESLVKLVQEEKSLVPYSDDMVRKLQAVVQDPDAGVRSTGAKAMASLAAAISDDKVLAIIMWCLGVMGKATSSAERSGAAEAFCEAVSKGGPPRFAALHGELERGLQSEQPSTREGFINIIVYTPSAFPEQMFTPLLPSLFQWVLRGLGDSVESVRNVALKAGSTIITGYGTRTLQYVLGPLVDGVCSEVSSTRQACLLLTSKLLIHLVQVLRRQHRLKHNIEDDDEDEDGDGTGNKKESGAGTGESDEDEPVTADEAAAKIQAVSAREAERASGFSVLQGLKDVIGEERFIRILAAMHVARFEHNANVRAEVHNSWMIAVASLRTAVNLCINPGLVDICVRFASSDNPECNDLAERILEFTAQRLHETLDVFLLSFSKHYENDSIRHKIGALACMAEVVPCCDPDRIHRLGPHLVRCVLDGLQHENERARTCAGAVFDRVSKIVGGKWIDSMVEQQLNTSVVGVVELVRVRPVSSLASVFRAYGSKVKDSDVTPHDVRLLKALIELEDTRSDLVKHYDRISNMLLAAERCGVPEAAGAITAFGESLVFEYTGGPIQDIARALKTPESRGGAIRAAAALFFGIRAKYTDVLEQLLRMVVHHMADALPEVRDAAARSLQQMISALDGKAAQLFNSEEKADMLLAKGSSGRYALGYLEVITSSLAASVNATLNPGETVFAPFCNQIVFDALFTNFFIKYIEHGKPAQKVQALEGIHHMLSHSKIESVIPCLVSIGGKCVRFLTSKQEGAVLSATMNLVAFLMSINGGGKEVVFENTLAASLCATMLCDSTEAKVTADLVAMRLVKKNNLNAEKLLGGIGARKSNVETDAHRASLSRFIAIVVRAAQLERKAIAIPALFTMVKGYFDAPDGTIVAAAAGSCIGVLVMNPSVADSDVAAVAEAAIRNVRAKAGNNAMAGIAFLASALHNTKSLERVKAAYAPFADNVAAAIQSALESCSNDRTVAAWTLRLAAVAGKRSGVVLGNKSCMETVLKIAKGLHRSDDMLHGALDFFVEALPAAKDLSAAADKKFVEDISNMYHAKTKLCVESLESIYEMDVEDELGSDTKYF